MFAKRFCWRFSFFAHRQVGVFARSNDEASPPPGPKPYQAGTAWQGLPYITLALSLQLPRQHLAGKYLPRVHHSPY